jgi:hypothetical protein
MSSSSRASLFACVVALVATSALTAQTGQLLRNRGAAQKCIEVAGGKRDPGTALQMADCQSADGQRFSYMYDEKDVQSAGQIRAFGGAVCLSANGNAQGRSLNVAACQNGNDFIWLHAPDGPASDAVSIRNAYSGLCVDLPTGALGKAAAVILNTCNGSATQKWDWVATPTATVAPANRGVVSQAGAASASKSPPPAPAPRAESRSVQSLSAPVVQKLYVLDGTQIVFADHDALWQVWDAWSAHAQHFDGVNLLGGDMTPKYNAAYSMVCSDVRTKGVNQVFIVGYSRGAIQAIKLANETRRSCGANVKFLGLVDAVNSLNYDWPTSVDPGIPVSIHLRKQADWEHVLTTANVKGIQTIKAPQFAWHHGMVCADNPTQWQWVRDQLISYAQRAGGRFDLPYTRRTTDCH